jgi:hypothetical protein
MPNGDKIDLSAAAQDQDFLRADMKDKIAYLAAHDQDFAKASRQDQLDYVNYILGQGKPEPPSAFDRLTAGYNPKLNEFAEKHPTANLLRPFDAAGGMVMGALPAAYQAFMHPIDTAVSTVSDLASWMDPNTAKGALSVLPEAIGGAALPVLAGEAVGPKAIRGAARKAVLTPEGKARLPIKLISPRRAAVLEKSLAPPKPAPPAPPETFPKATSSGKPSMTSPSGQTQLSPAPAPAAKPAPPDPFAGMTSSGKPSMTSASGQTALTQPTAPPEVPGVNAAKQPTAAGKARVGSAGDLATWSEEDLWAQYMKHRGSPLGDAIGKEIQRRGLAKASAGTVRPG